MGVGPEGHDRGAAAASLTAARGANPTGARRYATVVFADVAGSMDLAEHLDPEDWSELVGTLFDALSQAVVQYGGTVAQFTGDGLLAYFGVHTALEDHARRACAAALEMRRLAAPLSITVRIGINSGEIVLANVGHAQDGKPFALGHTVGLAQRMEALAPPGEVYVTENTAQLARSHFALVDRGEHDIKGSSAAIRVWSLSGSKHSRSRPVASVPIIGRDGQLQELRRLLDAAAAGAAQIVGIVGDAGVGKSRLSDEFAATAARAGVRVRRASGVSHAADAPLLPVLELLRDYFDIADTDSGDEARTRVEQRVRALDPALTEALPLLWDFMEIADPQQPAPRLSPEARMDAIFTVIAQITGRRSDRETLLLVLEDLHWFDPNSVRFFETLARSFPGTRTMMLTNFRPEFSAPWRRAQHYTEMPLPPLDAEAAATLVTELVGGDESLRDLAGTITESTSGSPFFIEEVVRSLVENGILVGEPGRYQLAHEVHAVGVPPTVQAVLAARIDRLDDDDKDLLETASVIGRMFSRPVLLLVAAGPPGDVDASLDRLCAGEFIERVPGTQPPEYRFWHPLTQEVAYRGMLRDRRRELHRQVAQAMIATEPAGLAERAALLAMHFDRAGDRAESARWHNRAGDFALRTDVDEAVRRWRVVVEAVQDLPPTEEMLKLGIQASNRLIRFGARTGLDPQEGHRLYTEARAMAEQLGDDAQIALATVGYGSDRFWRGYLKDALSFYIEAADLAGQAGDFGARASYLGTVALCGTFVGPLSVGRAAADEIDRLCAGDPTFGFASLAWSPLSPMFFTRAELLWYTGHTADARRQLHNVVDGARERGETEFVIWAGGSFARMSSTADEYAESYDIAREMVDLARAAGNKAGLVIALAGVGIAELGLGRYADATVDLEQALREGRTHQTGLYEEARIVAHLARAHAALGDFATACEVADQAVAIARRQGAGVIEALTLLARADVSEAARGRTEQVTRDRAAALDLASRLGAMRFITESAQRGQSGHRHGSVP